MTDELISESNVKPGSGLAIRYGSKFQSYFTNPAYANKKTLVKEDKAPTKDVKSVNPVNSLNSGKQKSTNHQNMNSLISSGMQKSDEVKQSSEHDMGR